MAHVYSQRMAIPAHLLEVVSLLGETAPTKFGMPKDIVAAWLAHAATDVAARDVALARVAAVLAEHLRSSGA